MKQKARQYAASNEGADSPRAKLVKVFNDGRITIQFTKEVHTVPNLTIINNGTVMVNGEEKPVLHLEMIPGMSSNIEDLKFTWNATFQNNLELDVHLYFENPAYVSAN